MCICSVSVVVFVVVCYFFYLLFFIVVSSSECLVLHPCAMRETERQSKVGIGDVKYVMHCCSAINLRIANAHI